MFFDLKRFICYNKKEFRFFSTNMRLFFNISNFLIVLVILLNLLFIEYGWDQILINRWLTETGIVGLILLVEAIIIIFIIKTVYEDPIIELELTIKKFLLGQLKTDKIKLGKSNNPHLNFVIWFFSETLNTLKNIKSEFIRGKEIKSEVDLAREIQAKLLEKTIIDIPSLNVIAKSKPAAEIGWDSYDVIKEWDNYYIYVWDATGHWVGAWFIMMMVNALISWFSKIYQTWEQILAKTNEILKPRVKANLLMSLLLVRWNEKEKRLFMTGAGHEFLLVYKAKMWKCFKIKSGWVALWMIKDISKLIKENEIKFEKNDIFILYSDWVTEAIDQPKKTGSEQRFEEDRLIAAIESAPNVPWKTYKNATSVFNNITINLSKFMWYQHTQLDDVTLLVAHYRWDEFNIEEDKEAPIPKDLITEWSW